MVTLSAVRRPGQPERWAGRKALGMTHHVRQVTGPLLTHVGLGLVVAVVVTIPWSALVVLNVRLSPHLPWAIPTGMAYASLAMGYLNGSGWPKSTSAARRRDFRAQPLAPAPFTWALLAGLAAVAALWLLAAAAGALSSPASPAAEAELPTSLLIGAIIVGAAVTAIAEEGGLRGFMQAPLERVFGAVPAIATTSVIFVLIHLSHGISALSRSAPFYFAAGCVYGLLAYLTQSILPSLLLHFLGDMLAFGLRSSVVRLVSPSQVSARAFLLLIALVLAGASGAVFLKLARLTAARRAHLGISFAAV